MKYRSLLVLVGVLVVGLTGCSHHHGSYRHGKGDYYWSKASQDVSGLIDKHVKKSGDGQAGQCGDGGDDHGDQVGP